METILLRRCAPCDHGSHRRQAEFPREIVGSFFIHFYFHSFLTQFIFLIFKIISLGKYYSPIQNQNFFRFSAFSAFSAFLKKYMKIWIPRKKFTKSGKRGKKGKREILEIRVFAAAPRAICDENGHNFKQGRPRRQPRNPVLICAYVVKSSGK